MELINIVVNSDIFQIIFKLLLSSLLAGVIGIERSSLSKPAGFGTHAIIGLSAALVVMASQFMTYHYNIDASRIPSQLLTGIGFIGAGTIIRNGMNVRGVTTSAGILSVTCIGIAVGMGYYEAAIIATLIVFIVLSVNHDVNDRFERFETINLSIVVDKNLVSTVNDIKEFFKKEKIVITNISRDTDVIKDKKMEIIKVEATFDTKHITKNEIVSEIISMKTVKEVSHNDL